jgi:hypothetical protein
VEVISGLAEQLLAFQEELIHNYNIGEKKELDKNIVVF